MYSAPIKKRNKYHDSYIIAIVLGLVPFYELLRIPRSTRYKFLNTPVEKCAELIGIEYSNDFDLTNSDLPEKVNLVQQFARSKKAMALFKAALLVKTTIINILVTCGSLKHTSKTVRKRIVSVINRVKPILGFERTLHYFTITKKTFYNWSKQALHDCADSALNRCRKIWPTQLTPPEINVLKEVVTQKKALFWPMKVIWGHAFTNGLLSFSYSTFLKYTKLLSLTEYAASYRKKPRKGLLAEMINQIWHMDVTIFKTINGMRHYIYFVIDNFSNLILSWHVDTRLSADIRKQTVEMAYQKYGRCNSQIIYSDVFPLINADLTIENYYIHLISDGGPENYGCVDQYLSDPAVKIRKLIALKDINYSNSAIEALNKIVKFNQLHLKDIPDTAALVKTLDTFVPMYNNERPNRKGGYLLTPAQIYNGMTVSSLETKRRMAEGKKNRILYNTTNTCGKC